MAAMNTMRGILAGIASDEERLLLTRRMSQNQSIETAHAQMLSMLDFVPIMMCDIDGTVRFWSEGCRRLYGWTAEQAIGQLSQELLQTIFPLPAGEIAAALLRDGEWSGELSQQTRDDGEVIVLTHRVLQRDRDETPAGFKELVTDVTRLRAMEAALQQCQMLLKVADTPDAALRDSEAQLRQFIDDAPAAIAMLDTSMRYVVVSRRYALSPILSTSRHLKDQASLIGRSYYDLFPNTSATRRADHDRVLAGETLRGDADRYQLADGSAAWVSWEAVPWRKPDGTIGGTMAGFEVVTDRKTAELALQDSVARLRLVQQVGGIAYTDRAIPGQIALVSHEYAQIYGLPPGQTHASTKEFIARIHPDDRDRVVSRTPASLVGNGRLATEFRIWRPDGALRWISIRAEAFLGPNGRPNRIISAQQDITELVATRETLAVRNEELKQLTQHLAAARDRAEQANRAKSRFLAGMSHELRTPLNGIIGYARLLHMEGGMNAAQRVRVDAMLEAGKHLLEMITGVLDLSEIEANHVELKPVSFDVLALAKACLDLIRPTTQAKGLTLSIVVAPGSQQELVADPTRLRQVLLNLLGNAAKFTSQGGIELRLRTLADGSTLRIEGADTGPGITAELRKRLFQDFARLDVSGTSTVGGAGLGLALSARLAILMGGRLDHADSPGGGSIFWLELPPDVIAAAAPASAAALDPPDTSPKPARIQALHVLVVDDVLMNREIAGSFMRSAGHRVTSVEGGAEAVAAAKSTDFDVVLMDVRMPGMDGLEATRRIRLIGGVRGRVPIVALTAQAFTEQVTECRDAGMDDHLPKPFTPDQLLSAVSRAVSASQSRSEVAMPPTVDAAPAKPIFGAELAVFETDTFSRTTGMLPPEAVGSYLRTIAKNAEVLLRTLHEPDALIRASKDLADAAHAIAGSAGMLGFARLATVGRQFEHAAASGAPEMPAIADGLAAALEATLRSIQERTTIAAG
jgi:PAS domain S-box-containing protein